MNAARFSLVILAVALGCQQQAHNPTRGSLIALTTESLAPLIQQQAAEFHRLYPDASISVLPTSTRDAIVQMLNDSVHLVFTDRALNEEERAVAKKYNIDFVENRVAEDALAVIVNKRNPIEKVAFASLEAILSGRAKNWRHVVESRWSGEIELALTGRNSGVYELLTDHFFKLKDPLVPHRVVSEQKQVLKFVGQNPRAIGIVSVATVRDTAGNPDLPAMVATVRVLDVAGRDTAKEARFVQLHQYNVYQEVYPLHYPLYLYTTASSTSVAAGFGAFIASTPGQKIFQKAGLAPKTVPVRFVQITQE